MRARLLLTSIHVVGPLFESEVGQLSDRTLAAMSRWRTPASCAQLLDGSTLNTHHIPADPLPIAQN
jgi:hypothetical protein